MIKENKRKIMTYPFSGYDYDDIKEIGERVCIYDNKVLYLTPSIDNYNVKKVDSSIISDERLKGMLCYFYFLNDLCRRYFNMHTVKNFSSDYDIPSFNTYIDTILITINEMVSSCKYNNIDFDFSSNFASSLNSDCLSSIYNLLINDSYIIHPSKYRDKGVIFDKIMDGTLNYMVNDIINNKDDISNVSIESEKPRTVVLKKVYGDKVI